MQPFQYDLRCSAAKDNSITHAAAAPSNLDAATTMRSAETELQNTKELRATVSKIAASKPDLDAKAKKDDFERAGGERRTGERAARPREIACVNLSASAAAAAVSLLGWGGRLGGRSWARRLVGRGNKGFPAPGVELIDAAQQGGTGASVPRGGVMEQKTRDEEEEDPRSAELLSRGPVPSDDAQSGGDHELGRRLEATDRTGEFRRQVDCVQPSPRGGWDAGGQGRRGTSGSGPGESEAVSAVASVAVHVGPGAWAPGSAVPVRALADGPGDLGARALAC